MKGPCPDCTPEPGFDRRQFFQATAATAAAIATAGSRPLFAAPTKTSAAETAVKALYDTLTPVQKKEICFAWDHMDKDRGLLRTRVANNWMITKPTISGGPFYTPKQQGIIRDIYKGLIDPEWRERLDKQMKDDSGGKPWGSTQSIAIFGEPGSDQFEFVLTGRHQTLRADGHSAPHVAFGGPIFYGHAPHDDEEPTHPGNVFWPQAVAANKVYTMLDSKQQKQAQCAKTPREQAVSFRGKSIEEAPGLSVKSMSRDQKSEMQNVLKLLLAPFRVEDRDEALQHLTKQGGLDACRLTFFTDNDIGDDKVWDNWRLEGPSFVWYFRGSPHVHVWVNIADSADVKTNS
ncbi:MAG: DUF3500 domain-containing protein [Gemmataceae bacterium]